MHLIDVPEDVLYLIFAGLGVEEAVALEQTCRTLHALAQTTQFWLIIAKSLSSRHPLPLPPFHVSLHTLSRLELKKACIRHDQTTKNLHSSKPKVFKRRTLVLGGEQAETNVYHFAFLPGGRYIITILLDGTFSCWDYSNSAYRPSSRPDSSSSYEENTLPDEPLAKYYTNQKPLSWNFQSFPDRPEVLVTILTGEADDWGEARLTNLNVHVLRLNFIVEGYLRIEVLAVNKVPFPCGRIFIQNEVVCSTGVFDNSVFLFFNDWKSNLVCVIDTTIREDCWKFDSFALRDNSLILYHETGGEVIVHQYLNLQDLIYKNGTTPPSALTPPSLRPSFHKVITLQPDISKRLRFEIPSPPPSDSPPSPSNSSPLLPQVETGSLQANNNWFTTHPWNTPNPAFTRPLSIMSTSRGVIFSSDDDEDIEIDEDTEDDPRAIVYRTLTHHWFDPSLLSSAPPLSTGCSEGHSSRDDVKPTPGFCRWVHHLPDVIGTGIISSELVCPGSEGTHLFWLCDGGTSGGGLKIQLALLPSPEETAYASKVPSQLRVRDLDLGPDLELSGISTMDIDDAHGVFGLGMYSDGMEQRIHMLYY